MREGRGVSETAQEAADEGRFALRLAAATALLSAPEPAAPVLAELPAGALVTVRADAGAFLQVIATDDAFGYIADSTPVTVLEYIPGVEKPPSPPVFPAEMSARQFLAGEAPTPPAAASVVGVSMSARAEEEPFTPARPLAPGERVLIYDRIGQNRRATFILMAGFVLLMTAFFGAIGLVVSIYSGAGDQIDTGLAIRAGAAAAIVGLAIGLLMYYTASAAVLSISGARQVVKEEEPQLYRIVENLSIGSGLPMPKVWVIEDSAPNAFATGRKPGNAHVAATRGLLDKLQKRELEAVMAHEMSHVGNYDIRLMTTVAVVVGLTALASDFMLRFSRFGAGMRTSNRGKGSGALVLIILALAILFIIISPIIAGIMRLALSRQREYLADATGALLCRNPAALADALQKISADTEPLEVANKATAHLYIANPLKGHESFLNSLFSTHPPVAERIRLLRAM